MIGLYARVSTQEQAKEGYSIDEQIDRLKKYSEAMGWKEYKLYVDAGYSGGNIFRPELQNIIKDAKEGKLEKIVVYKLDRLSRSQKDTLLLIEDVFLANNCDFVSMSENFDTSTPFGRAMIGILAVFAQLEREQIKERMSMGREARAKEGKWLGVKNVPIGYRYIDGELVIDKYEAMQIKELFDLYLQGYSSRQIAKEFQNKGYSNIYGKWYEKRIQTTLSNKLYIGYVGFNQNYYKGLHEPIIDTETFEKAQKMTESRKRSVVPSAKKSTYLGGLLFCMNCGARYGIYVTGGYKYYACHSRRKRNVAMIKDPNCKNKTYRMERLDQVIFDEIKKLSTDPNYIFEIKNENPLQTEKDNKIKLIKSEIEKIDNQRSRFMDLYGLGDFTSEELQQKVAPLKEQKEKLLSELESLNYQESELSIDETVKIVSNFSDVLDRGVYEEIRLVIESLIEKIEIDNDNIFIHWRFA